MAPSSPTPEWRPLSPLHTSQVVSIASTIHPDLPERDAVFEERITLFPSGCLGLFKKHDSTAPTTTPNSNSNSNSNKKQEPEQELCGYIISHPIHHHSPPPLDTLLHHIPSNASQYYIHDLAMLPEFRGSGLAQRGVEKVLETAAKGFETSGLVSVYGTAGFWGKFGFTEPENTEDGLREKVGGMVKGLGFLSGRIEMDRWTWLYDNSIHGAVPRKMRLRHCELKRGVVLEVEESSQLDREKVLSRDLGKKKQKAKTYNSGDSPVVTHLTTNPPVSSLNRADRTGCLNFSSLWSYVPD